MKNIKKYLVILLFFLVLWIAYFTFINWKCRIIIKDNVFIGIKSGITEKKEDLKVVEIPDGVSDFDVELIRGRLKTDPDTAFFWSGQTDSIGGMDVAKKIAKNKGGVTLESTIDDTNIVMPEWDFNAPSSVTAWEEASNVYAEQVSGEIRAVVGSELRPGNIWENIELPRLKANPNVTKITTIDPKTGVEKIIFER